MLAPRNRAAFACSFTLRAVAAVAAVLAVFIAVSPISAAPAKGMWLTQSEVGGLPMTGSAWTSVKASADASLGTARISDQNSSHDIKTLAVALVYVRTGDVTYRKKAADAIMSAVGTESGGRTLALGRNLGGYVIAADLINLHDYDSAKDSQFRAWLSSVRSANLDGDTLVSTAELRPNNWGTHAGAARVAADVYLGDVGDLSRAVQVFRGWLGERSQYSGFKFGDLSWQADPANPVGVNRKGALLQGKSVDGVLPDDQRRSGGFSWPPPKQNYVWEALGPAFVEAELLYRAGYSDAYRWSDSALLRAITWLNTVDGFPAQGDDGWLPWLANFAYGSRFATTSRADGKSMAWTNWTHARSR